MPEVVPELQAYLGRDISKIYGSLGRKLGCVPFSRRYNLAAKAGRDRTEVM